MVSRTTQLKLTATDGKRYSTDCSYYYEQESDMCYSTDFEETQKS